jgi:hypothetical protein
MDSNTSIYRGIGVHGFSNEGVSVISMDIFQITLIGSSLALRLQQQPSLASCFRWIVAKRLRKAAGTIYSCKIGT